MSRPRFLWLALVLLATTRSPSRALAPPGPPRVEPAAGRRAFLSAALATVAGTAAPTRARAGFWGEEEKWQKKARASSEAVPYARFKELLSEGNISDVEFGSDGRSIVWRTVDGGTSRVPDPTDDPGLLKELYARGVGVSVEEYKFQKQMNSYSFLRQLVGEELTDEEMYKYKGYKTVRQNMPERAYLPSNLITGYDLSRAQKKEEERKQTGFFQDLNYFVKNGNNKPSY